MIQLKKIICQDMSLGKQWWATTSRIDYQRQLTHWALTCKHLRDVGNLWLEVSPMGRPDSPNPHPHLELLSDSKALLSQDLCLTLRLPNLIISLGHKKLTNFKDNRPHLLQGQTTALQKPGLL